MKKFSILVVFVISLVSLVSCVSKEVPVTETYYETEYRTEQYTDIEKVATTTKGEDELKPEVYWWSNQIYYQTDPTEKRYSSKSYLWYFGYELPKYKTARVSVNTWAEPTLIKAYNVSDINHIDSPQDVPGAGEASPYMIAQSLPDWPWWKRPEGWKPSPEVGWPGYALNSYIAFFNSILNADRLIYQVYYPQGDTGEFDVSGVTKLALLVEVSGFGLGTNPLRGIKIVWTNEIVKEETVTKERQVPYQVEKQRTVMQTKKVPFWEVWKAKPAAEAPSPAPVTTEVGPPAPSPKLLYEDDFSNSYSGWGTGSDDWGKFAYEGGEYSISIERTNWFDYHLNSVSGMQEDFTVEVDARKLSQGTDDAAGIVFRDQRGQGKDSFYVFWVNSNSGTYAVQKYTKNVWAPDLKDFTQSNYINRGANTNQLKVICKGSQIAVYANDYKLTTVTDTSLSNGYIGLAAETLTSPNAHYHFDNFKLDTND